MRKQTSSNSLNKKVTNNKCGISYTISVISGRWKLNILSYLKEYEVLRFSELKRKIEGISERMLVSQLKELESDELIERFVYAEVPPKVEYKLSEKGKTLDNVLEEMNSWGEKNKEDKK